MFNNVTVSLLGVRKFSPFLLSFFLLAGLFFVVSPQAVLSHLATISLPSLSLALLSLFLSVFVGSLRFYLLTKASGSHFPLRLSHKINVVAMFIGGFLLQAAGNIMARGIYSNFYTKQGDKVTWLTFVEKILTFLVLLLLAFFFLLYGFIQGEGTILATKILTPDFFTFNDGTVLIKKENRWVFMLSAILVCFPCVWLFALRRGERGYISNIIPVLQSLKLFRAFSLTTLQQFLTVLSFIFLSHAVIPDLPLSLSFAVFSLVTLLSSLPISFNGWGVREGSTGVLLGFLGFDPGLGISIALAYGGLTFLSQFLHFLLVQMIKFSPARKETSYGDYFSAPAPLLFFCSGIAIVFFLTVLMHFRLLGHPGSFTPSDPFALVAGIAFFILYWSRFHGHPLWRVQGVGVGFACFVLMIGYGWGLAFFTYSPNEWATFNRLLGLVLLFGYLLSGVAFAFFFSSRSHFLLVDIVFTIACVMLVFFFLFPQAFVASRYRFVGNMANPNSFSFFMVASLPFLIVQLPKRSINQQNLFLFILSSSVILTRSMAGLIALTSLVALALFVNSFFRKNAFRLLFWLTLPFSINFIVINIPYLFFHFRKLDIITSSVKLPVLFPVWLFFLLKKDRRRYILSFLKHFFAQKYIYPLSLGLIILLPPISIPILTASKERMVFKLPTNSYSQKIGPYSQKNVRPFLYRRALELWMEKPFFGQGLGYFYEESKSLLHITRKKMATHNDFLWILSETGLFGLSLFLVLPLLIARHVFQHWRTDYQTATILFLLTVCVFVFMMTHNILYQRYLWLILGLVLVKPCHGLGKTLLKSGVRG